MVAFISADPGVFSRKLGSTYAPLNPGIAGTVHVRPEKRYYNKLLNLLDRVLS